MRSDQTATVDSQLLADSVWTVGLRILLQWTALDSEQTGLFSHGIITTSVNPSNSFQILARSLFCQPIIGILAPLVPLHPWC